MCVCVCVAGASASFVKDDQVLVCNNGERSAGKDIFQMLAVLILV